MEQLGFYNSIILAKEKYGDKIVAKDDNDEITYSQLLSRIDCISEQLSKKGVKAGDKVGIFGFNCCNWLPTFFAIVKIHAVAVCLNYSFSVNEVNEYLKLTNCEYLIYGNFAGLKKDPDFIKKVCLSKDKCMSFDSFTFSYKKDFKYIDLSLEEYASPAFIIFTSGSTGKSKGSMLTQKSSLDGAKGFLDAIFEIENESVCVGVPLFHVYGLSLSVAHLINGGCLYLPSIFSSEIILKYLNSYKLQGLIGVMTVVIRLLDDPSFNKAGYPEIKRIYTGGSPLMPMQCYRVERSFGNACLLNCYGQSETDAGITITTPRDSLTDRVETVGKPCSHRKVYILGPNNEFCKPNEKGEIVLFDDGAITKGYYNAPKDVQPIDDRGYLHTGDLGFLDDRGYLHLAGRIKDIIIKGGENIVPTDIEKVINELDEIKLVKVMGARNELYGESIEACVVLNDSFANKGIAGNDIIAKLKGKISPFKMPSHVFVFESFPLKPNGKLDACKLSIDMLDRLNAAVVENDMKSGIDIISLKFKKQDYVIPTILKTTQGILDTVGITNKKIKNKILISTEEMLTEIVNHSYIESGSTRIVFTLFTDFFRISFYNESNVVLFDGKHDSLSVTIIINSASRITREDLNNGKMKYNFDFSFSENYNPKEYFVNLKPISLD